MEDIIVCEGLNKYYSGVHALKDLSLKIKKDSVVGLIGDNGAGKSTLIKILSDSINVLIFEHPNFLIDFVILTPSDEPLPEKPAPSI